MAEISSTLQLKPGSPAPPFELPDGSAVRHSLGALATGMNAVVIVFACNHCPFVVHLADALGRMARDLVPRGVQVIAINANDAARYPADAPERMPDFASRHGWDFPYLHDESQEVAKAYAAACTPDFYVFDHRLRLAYAGQFDSTRPGRGGHPDGADLRRAIETLLTTGIGPEPPWMPGSGCSIKWKPGQAPNDS